MCLDYNLQYRPVDTDRVRREIQSAQTVIELLLLMAEEKEAEKPARSGNFETTFTVDGKERKVERTPDGRFAATKKAVGDAAAGKAIGDTTKGLLETDADKIRQQGAAAFDTGNWEDLDYFGKKQIKKHPELSPKLEDIAANLQLAITAYALGDQQAEKDIRDYFNEIADVIADSMEADVIADSMEGDAEMIDKVKKGIKELPQNIKKTVSDTAKSLQENSSKAIADAEAAFVMADKPTKEAIGNAQKSALDTLEKGKKGILDKVGATGKAASDAFSSVLKAASSAGDGVKQKVDAAKQKGKEIIDSIGKSAIEKGKEAFASVDLDALEKVKNAVVTATGAIACALTVGVSFGAGAMIGAGTTRFVLSVLPGMGSLSSTIIGVMSGLNVAEILIHDSLGVIPAMMKDVEQAFENIKSSIEKAKTEQEAKREEPKEVSAAALDYLGYILGY